jgi:predicted transcriptional regulator of viral defense system
MALKSGLWTIVTWIHPAYKENLNMTLRHDPATCPRGRVICLHKGWYTLANPFCKETPSLMVLACTMKSGTYVSHLSALDYHGMIPEHAAGIPCVATGRPQLVNAPLN